MFSIALLMKTDTLERQDLLSMYLALHHENDIVVVINITTDVMVVLSDCKP